jgi:hypothetical protein
MTDKEYTLATLAAALDAKAFEEWQRARRDAARATLRGEDGPGTWHGAAVARQGAALINSLLYGLEPSEAEQHRRKAADALAGLQLSIGDALAADYVAEGMIGPHAEVRVVPREIARQLTADLADNTLRTTDGAYVWRAVVVRKAGRATVATPAIDTAPAVDAPDSKQAATWVGPIITRIVADSRQLTRRQFDDMVRAQSFASAATSRQGQ